MKKVWKWIIGIILGLVIIAVLVGVAFMVKSHFYGYCAESFGPRNFSNRGPDYFERGPGMMPYGGYGHMRGTGMMGYGFSPFGGIFGGLISLGFLALVVLGVIWLVNRLRTPQRVEVPAVIPAAVPVEIVKPCKQCGRPLQDEWKVCPHCGKKV
jgi:hypothetical protein